MITRSGSPQSVIAHKALVLTDEMQSYPQFGMVQLVLQMKSGTNAGHDGGPVAIPYDPRVATPTRLTAFTVLPVLCFWLL